MAGRQPRGDGAVNHERACDRQPNSREQGVAVFCASSLQTSQMCSGFGSSSLGSISSDDVLPFACVHNRLRFERVAHTHQSYL